MTSTELARVRPYAGAFAAVIVLQVIGAVAGLAPLLAIVELGRALLAPGPADDDHVRSVMAAGAAGLFVRLLFTGAVLEDGVVVEHGRPADLLAADGAFAALWRSRPRAADSSAATDSTAGGGRDSRLGGGRDGARERL
jgi:hypothetical protein